MRKGNADPAAQKTLDRKGSQLSGKHIRRNTPTSEWYYRFTVGGVRHEGPLGTFNKKDVEELANIKYQKALMAWRERRSRGEDELIPTLIADAVDGWMNSDEGKARKDKRDFPFQAAFLK